MEGGNEAAVVLGLMTTEKQVDMGISQKKSPEGKI